MSFDEMWGQARDNALTRQQSSTRLNQLAASGGSGSGGSDYTVTSPDLKAVGNEAQELFHGWGGSGELADRDGLFNFEGKHLRDLGESSTANFLRALAADEESYNTVSVAQQTYGASLMAAQGNHQDNALDAGLHSVSMHGLLDQARSESIGEQFAEDAKERNKQLEKQGEWRNFAAGATVGLVVGVASELIIPTRAAAAIAVPLAFEVAGGAAETYMATQTIDWLDENEYKNDQQAVEGIQKARQDGQHNAMTPLLNYAAQNDMSPTEVRELVRRAQGTYHDGGEYTDTDDARGW